jgi:hypothetical protein
VTPRVPLSFPIGITAVFDEEEATIKIRNNTPLLQLERQLSIRCGVPVKLAPGEPTVWMPNKKCQFLSVIPGQKAAMTEAMIKAATPPTKIDFLVTVCDCPRKYAQPVRVPTDASWDQVMMIGRAQVCAADPEMARFPGVANAYVMKTESGDPVTSMDGLTKVFAHFMSSMISQLKTGDLFRDPRPLSHCSLGNA